MIYRTKNWSEHRSSNLRLWLEPSLAYEVKHCCKVFHKWLRKEFEYPVKIIIKVVNRRGFVGLYASWCAGSVYLPKEVNRHDYPVMQVAGRCNFTNDISNNDNELGGVLDLIMYNLSHYFQWIENGFRGFPDIEEAAKVAEKFSEEWLDWYAYKHRHLYRISKHK